MVIGQSSGKTAHMYKLDAKLCTDKVKKTMKLADRSLSLYGEPSMSLEQLRATVDKELGDSSLTELIIKEREAGL